MRGHDRQVWAAINECARRAGVPISLTHAVTACAELLSASAGVGVSLSRDGAQLVPTMASSPTAEELEELQFTVGQGPGVDAMAGLGPVLAEDLALPAARQRWPVFAAAADERGARAMFAFPVATGSARIGVLDVYRAHPGSLTASQLADGLAFADAILVLALDERGGITAGMFADTVITAGHAQIHQATGVIAAQLDVSMSDALAALRAHAYARGMRLADLAADVLAHRIRLGPGPPDPAAGESQVADPAGEDRSDNWNDASPGAQPGGQQEEETGP